MHSLYTALNATFNLNHYMCGVIKPHIILGRIKTSLPFGALLGRP